MHSLQKTIEEMDEEDEDETSEPVLDWVSKIYRFIYMCRVQMTF